MAEHVGYRLEMNAYIPLTETTVPIGEGALERVFACIERIDPSFRHFTTILIRDPKLERYPDVDEGGFDNALRGSYIDLPSPPLRPPTTEEVRSVPGTLKIYDHRNAPDVASFLFGIHSSTRRCAHFYTFAVLVIYRPPLHEVALDGQATAPVRLFSGAPKTKAVGLLACSGNRLVLYSGKDALDYFNRCNRFIAPNAIAGHAGVDAQRLLPYLDISARHTLDVAQPYDPYLRECDEQTKACIEYIFNGCGFGVYGFPEGNINRYHYEQLRDQVFKTYVDWVNAQNEYRMFFGSWMPFRFVRPREYMVNRYPTIRDWMLNARVGNTTANKPEWPSLNSMLELIVQAAPADTTGIEDKSYMEIFADEIIAHVKEDSPTTEYFGPNFLSNVAEDGYMLLRRVFTERKRLESVTAEEGEKNIEYIFCDTGCDQLHDGTPVAVGLLMHLLADIAAIDTDTVLRSYGK